MNPLPLIVYPIIAIMAVFVIGFFGDFYGAALSQRSNPATQTSACTTDAGGGCSFALNGEHALPDLSGALIDETAPGSADRTSLGTLGVDRQTVTMVGLAALTGYTFDVAYLAPRTDLPPIIGGLLNVFPWAVILGAFFLLLVVGVLLWTQMGR